MGRMKLPPATWPHAAEKAAADARTSETFVVVRPIARTLATLTPPTMSIPDTNLIDLTRIKPNSRGQIWGSWVPPKHPTQWSPNTNGKQPVVRGPVVTIVGARRTRGRAKHGPSTAGYGPPHQRKGHEAGTSHCSSRRVATRQVPDSTPVLVARGHSGVALGKLLSRDLAVAKIHDGHHLSPPLASMDPSRGRRHTGPRWTAAGVLLGQDRRDPKAMPASGNGSSGNTPCTAGCKTSRFHSSSLPPEAQWRTKVNATKRQSNKI
jgi:hypothetical protein